jgi:hypothetical protein
LCGVLPHYKPNDYASSYAGNSKIHTKPKTDFGLWIADCGFNISHRDYLFSEYAFCDHSSTIAAASPSCKNELKNGVSR